MNNECIFKSKQWKDAEEIINYFLTEPKLSDEEWLELQESIMNWMYEPSTECVEKCKFSFSGFAEMLSMICAGIREDREEKEEKVTEREAEIDFKWDLFINSEQ